MYANQGKPSDYEHLRKTIDLRGTIAITRYGGAGRAAKVSTTHPVSVETSCHSPPPRHKGCSEKYGPIKSHKDTVLILWIIVFIDVI